MEKTLGLHLVQDGTFVPMHSPKSLVHSSMQRVTVTHLGSSLQSLHKEGLCDFENGARQLRMLGSQRN